MLIVRPARMDDLNVFLELAHLAGPGFTSLAVSDKDLEERLVKSVKSFEKKTKKLGNDIFLLLLEENDTGEVIGVSAIKSRVGVDKPFFSFKLLSIVQSSSAANRHFNMDVMLLVNEYSGASEVGTLFVKPVMRGTGAGRLIAQARYMLIAAQPTRFADTVISELRGQVDDKGYSPFWEALGRKFFKMDFSEADKITAETDNQFITDLMPKYPIYTALLDEEAQAVIGKVHPHGIGARRLLEDEGFRYDNCVDIFDGGPTVAAPKHRIRTLNESRKVQADKLAGRKANTRVLISNDRVQDFRAIFTRAAVSDDTAYLKVDDMKALHVQIGDDVRILTVQPRSREKS